MRSLFVTVVASLATSCLAAPCNFPGLTSSLSKSLSWLSNPAVVIEDASYQFRADDEENNIYDTLRGRDEFSKVLKYINAHGDIKKMLQDESHKITFFAPSNDALSDRPMPGNPPFGGEGKESYIRDMLKYHIVDMEIEYRLFGQNSTIATALHADDGSFHGSRRRIKVESTPMPPWKVTLNNYAQITESDIRAKNGIIHKINMPLWLPPDIMDIAYMLPKEFAYTSTALLKVDLQHNYEFNSGYEKKGKGEEQRNDRHGRGSAVTTVFLPTNEAWEKLPEDLLFFLFSPFGEQALRKLMAWHTIPDTAVFSEWSRGKRSSSSFDELDLSFEWDHHYETLTSQKMPVHAKKTKSRVPGSQQYNVSLQGHGIYSNKFDNPAQNGVFHAVDQVLCPRNKEGESEDKNQKDWEEWKEWMKDWVQETRDRSA